jgi:hypothetical protein
VDEAERPTKPPLMTASAAGAADAGTEAKSPPSTGAPFPADEVGTTRKPASSPSSGPAGPSDGFGSGGRGSSPGGSGVGSAGGGRSSASGVGMSGVGSTGVPTRAEPTVPVDRSGDNGRGDTSPADRLGATASSFNSKLDLNGKLDRGRQAWRQLTGPNNWLSGRSASSSADTRISPAPAGYTDSSSGYGGNAGYGGSAYTAGGHAAGASSCASYGGPATGGTLSGSGSGSGSPYGSSSYDAGGGSYGSSAYGSSGGPGGTAPGSPAAGSATAGSAATRSAGTSAAGTTSTSYQGTRPATGSQDSSGPASWRSRATVSAAGKRKDSRRQAQLTLSRVEPWSVTKFSFVVSVVAFIVLFVAVALLYMVLSSLGVFDSLQHTVNNLTSAKNQAGTNVSSWFSASRVLGYTAMLGVLNIILITAISTIGAVIYNLIAQTIGGIEVTLRELD